MPMLSTMAGLSSYTKPKASVPKVRQSRNGADQRFRHTVLVEELPDGLSVFQFSGGWLHKTSIGGGFAPLNFENGWQVTSVPY